MLCEISGIKYNRLWWPSGLERVLNSSRYSLEDPGLNPRSRIYTSSMCLTHLLSLVL